MQSRVKKVGDMPKHPLLHPLYCKNCKAKNHKRLIGEVFEVSSVAFTLFWQSFPIYFNTVLGHFQVTIMNILSELYFLATNFYRK